MIVLLVMLQGADGSTAAVASPASACNGDVVFDGHASVFVQDGHAVKVWICTEVASCVSVVVEPDLAKFTACPRQILQLILPDIFLLSV